jgi:hypothetical protein
MHGDKGPGGVIYIIMLLAKFASYSTVVKVLGFGHREKTASGYAAAIPFVLAVQCLLEEFNVLWRVQLLFLAHLAIFILEYNFLWLSYGQNNW